MKISELQNSEIKDFCGISDDDSDRIIEIVKSSAKAFIMGYTGLSESQLDQHDDITDAFLILVNDMFSQRDYTLSLHRQVSPAVKTILGLYAKNYL